MNVDNKKLSAVDSLDAYLTRTPLVLSNGRYVSNDAYKKLDSALKEVADKLGYDTLVTSAIDEKGDQKTVIAQLPGNSKVHNSMIVTHSFELDALLLKENLSQEQVKNDIPNNVLVGPVLYVMSGCFDIDKLDLLVRRKDYEYLNTTTATLKAAYKTN